MKVLLILEDPTFDQYIVKPVVEKLFETMSWPARVDVLHEPHLRGADDLLSQLDEVVEDNPMVDIFIAVLDRDCDRKNHSAKLAARVAPHKAMFGVLAYQEVEVWMLGAQREVPGRWTEIRRECDPKEAYAEPWLLAQGYTRADVGRGRKAAMRALSGNFRRLMSRCDELQQLRQDLLEMRPSP